jgi:hypothetical protein
VELKPNRKFVFSYFVLTCDASTLCEGVSLIALVTDTYGDVASHPTRGMDATQTRARIHTFLIFAG